MNRDEWDQNEDKMYAGKNTHYSDEFYKAALVITGVGNTSLSGYCGCGTDAEWGILYHLLNAIDGRVEEPDECIRQYMTEGSGTMYWGEGQHSPYNGWGFPHEPIPEFLAKTLDSMGLTEHGTTVVWSWLTKKGKVFLDAMDVCITEYCKVNGLDEDEMRQGPFGYSAFNVSEMWLEDDTYVPDWVHALEQHTVVNEYIGMDVAYRLFTGSKYTLDDSFDSEEHKAAVEKVLNEIKDKMRNTQGVKE